MTKLERKYPLIFDAARTLTTRLLERGLKYYERGGAHTHLAWRKSRASRVGIPKGAS